MARPTAFDRQTSFTQFSSQFPAKPQNGASLDAEFNAAKVALDETQANLAAIQDDDGRLARGSVGRAQLDSSITLGFETPSTWQADTAYTADISTVFHEAKFYTALVTHVSTDTFDATKWAEIADLSASAAIEDGSITEAKLAASAVTADKLGAVAVTTPKLAAAAVTNAKLADEAVTLAKLASTLPAQLRDLILPAGLGPLPWPSNTAPAGWVFDGGTYSRAAYPALAAFALAEQAIGNLWFGVGDGATTFTITDAEGRAAVAVDTDGSTIGSGLTTPGQKVGAKDTTLATTNLPPYTPSGAITNGAITSTPSQSPVVTGVGGLAFGAGSAGGLNNLTITSTQAASSFTGAAQGGASTPISRVQPSIGVRFIFKAH